MVRRHGYGKEDLNTDSRRLARIFGHVEVLCGIDGIYLFGALWVDGGGRVCDRIWMDAWYLSPVFGWFVYDDVPWLGGIIAQTFY
jgi:hypothetical protein